MISKKIAITNISGLHLGASGRLVDEAVKYTNTTIHFKYGGDHTGNAKSMLSVLGANVKPGEEIELICDGPEEEKALLDLVELIETNFGEY